MKKDKSNKISKRTVSGQPADEIVLNPSDKPEKKLSEAITDTAVITFGRMNPPTVGHLSLVEKMLDIALENKGYPLIYLSHTYDPKKNPLSYDEKFDLVREAFGDYVQRSEANNPIAVLKEVSERFKNVIVVVGEDRVKDLVRITETYNGKDFNFDSTKVISAGQRDPDAEGIEGMSASKMRELAIEGNLTEFREGLPTQLQPSASVIINMIREGMDLKEELNKIFEQYIDEAGVLSVAGRRKKAIAARKYKARLKIARKRVQRRIALNPRLKKRTARAAIRVMRNRLAGGRGKKYTSLSPQEKASIDRRVRARKSIVSKLSTRLYPTTRKKEFARFKSFRTKKESINFEFENYLAEGQKKNLKEFPALPSEISYVMPHGNIKKKKAKKISNQDMNAYQQESLSEKAIANLQEKANSSKMSYDTILKVYESGGFNKVNEFIAKDKSNADALFEISAKTLMSYRDKARIASYGNKKNAKANDNMAKQAVAKGDNEGAMGHLERAKNKRMIAMKRDAGEQRALAKIKKKKEHLSPVNELDDKTLKSYEDKASADAKKKVKARDFDGAQKRHDGISRSLNTRLGRSVDRLKKSSSELSKATKSFIDRANQREETINELDKETLKSYVGKAQAERLNNIDKFEKESKRGEHIIAKSALKKVQKRGMGVKQAEKKLGEGMFDDLDHKFNKVFSTSERKRRRSDLQIKHNERMRDLKAKTKKLKKPSDMSEAVFDKDNPKKGVQKTRHNLVFSNRKHAERTYTRMRQKQDAYKKDDPIEKKEKESIKHRRVPEYAITTKSGKVEKKPQYKEGGERAKNYGGNENPISKMDKGKPFVDPKRK